MNRLTLNRKKIVFALECASEKMQNIFSYLMFNVKDESMVEKFEDLRRRYNPKGLQETLEVYNNIIGRYERMYPEEDFSFFID